MLELARVVRVSALTVALPFLVAAGLLLVSSLTTGLIEKRLKVVLKQWFAEEQVEIEKSSVPEDPASLAATTAWTVDAAQILAVVLGPVIGILILQPDFGGGLSVLYLVAAIVGLAAFFAFTFKVRADKYATMTWFRVLTPVSGSGIALNLVAAAVAAWVLGPK